MHSYNQFIYARERRLFGRQCLFSDRNQLMLSINPSIRHRLNYILRNPVNMSTQLSGQKALSVMVTENVTYDQHGMYHFEGGWPREVNIHDEESTLRYRKKIEREDNWGVQVCHLIQNAMEVVAQNCAVNIYEYFFEDLPPEAGEDIKEPFEARQQNLFHDITQPCRVLKNITWTPSDESKFMSHYTNMAAIEQNKLEVNEGAQVTGNAFYVWDLENPLKPLATFDAYEPVRIARFCPKDENYIAGGLHSGKVTMWDTRVGEFPYQVCPLESAHREPVSALCWVHSKTNSEFYTGSYDGSVKYWDGRDLNLPMQQLLLDPEPTNDQKRERAQGVSVLEFEYTIPVRYIIGSDMGYIFVGNRKGLLPTEALLANYRLFSGPIRTVERNPFFVKNFLIVGDWCAKIWAEECKGSPSTLLIKKKEELLCGSWSTARCSLFVTGSFNGDVDFYDLLLHHREPIFSCNVKSPVTNLKFRPDGHILAVGCYNGDIHLLELDPAMLFSSSKEKALIAALFERELLRCKLLEGRVEEIKLKRKTSVWEAEQRAKSEILASVPELDSEDPEQFLQILESDTEFKEALRYFTEMTTKVDKKRQEREFVMERTDFEVEYVEEVPAEDEEAGEDEIKSPDDKFDSATPTTPSPYFQSSTTKSDT